MEICLVVNAAFIAVIVMNLCVMLRIDMRPLQQCGFSSKAYYDWVRGTDDTCSTKRIVMLAVLIASTTSYAQSSWMVIGVLAIVTFMLTCYLWRQCSKTPLKFGKRMAAVYAVAICIAVIVTAMAALTAQTPPLQLQHAIYSALFFASFSYCLTLCANWLVAQFLGREAE